MKNNYNLSRSLRYAKALLMEYRFSIAISCFVLFSLMTVLFGPLFSISISADTKHVFPMFALVIGFFATICITLSVLDSGFKKSNVVYRVFLPVSRLEKMVGILLIGFILPSVVVFILVGLSLIISSFIVTGSLSLATIPDKLLTYMGGYLNLDYIIELLLFAFFTTSIYMFSRVISSKIKQNVGRFLVNLVGLVIGLMMYSYMKHYIENYEKQIFDIFELSKDIVLIAVFVIFTYVGFKKTEIR